MYLVWKNGWKNYFLKSWSPFISFDKIYRLICNNLHVALANEQDKEQFLEEIDLMKQIGYHANVLGMIGFWTRSEPFLLLLEYVPCGDLLNWLREKRKQVRFAYLRR